MDCKVDYINFSVPTRIPFISGNPDNEKNAQNVLVDFLGSWWQPIAFGHSWEFNEVKGFYHTRYFDNNSKASVFIGKTNSHVHCQFGGQTLDHIRTLGFYEYFMKKVGTRTSRIDFAVDFETECTVEQFIVNNERKAFKAGGQIFSEDGETSYIGSWKGERFARVYRYHEPHPRAKKLRAEVVLRGDYAKQAMTILLREGEVSATLAAHKAFQWKHELWKPSEATESKIVSQRSDKEAVNTIRWANGDVAAAIANIHNKGLQDAFQWFEQYVKPRLGK